eukprot:1314024-Amphidinium_carterae.2
MASRQVENENDQRLSKDVSEFHRESSHRVRGSDNQIDNHKAHSPSVVTSFCFLVSLISSRFQRPSSTWQVLKQVAKLSRTGHSCPRQHTTVNPSTPRDPQTEAKAAARASRQRC